MEKIEIIFTFNGLNTTIACTKRQKLKDLYTKFKNKAKVETKLLYYIYNGSTIKNDELTFDKIANSEDKKRKKMNILVNELLQEQPNQEQDECIIKSKDIICPECKDNIKFKLDDYNILLFECKNKHDKDLLIYEFNETQNINISKIICQNCKKYNKGNVHDNIFYKCNICKLNLCPICYSIHDKSHKIINYDDKYYICEKHNKEYIAYCKDCKQNICLFCEQNHKKHNILTYGQLLPNIDNINSHLKEFKEKKDILINEIKEIIDKLNRVIENINIYYKINENMINNYNKDKINYEILYNIKNIENNNIIKDIDNIINDNNIGEKFNKIINIYEKMYNKNQIEIIYNIDKSEDNIKIFGEDFVKNNINNCKMIIKGKEYKLSEKLNIKDYNRDKLTVILRGINNITNMSKMFYYCSLLSSLPDISKWNTSNVNDMSKIFYECKHLISLPDISKWNTSNVNDMNEIFYACESLTSLPDISKWNTFNVTNMFGMFWNCLSLKSLPNISNWNTSNVNDMSYMFDYCESLTSLPDISKWETSNVTNMSNMFWNCSSLKSLPDISIWNVSNVINMSELFHGCSLLSSLPDISKWNTSNVTNMSKMFYYCSLLISLPDISKWNTSNVKDMNEMFYYCSSLTSFPDISKWDTSYLEKYDDIFKGCDRILKKPVIKRKEWSIMDYFY